MEVIGDTSFFTDLERSRPEVHSWIHRNPTVRVLMTPVVYGELLVGQPERAKVERLASGMIGEITFDVARQFGLAGRFLRSKGERIGANDLWIASIALAYDLPVLTRNIIEFSRVPGLKVVTY